MKIFSIIILVLLSLILVVLALYLIIVRIYFHKALGRKKVAKRLEEKSNLINLYQIDLCWWEKNRFEDLTIVSEDGLKLKGHFLDKNSNKTAIVVHGYGSDYREMSNYAKMFADMGYNVLVPENRAHGKSEGNMIGMGWIDRLDIESWVNVLINKDPSCKIVLFGLSMGASAVCMTLGENLAKNVVCAIEDCGFENVYKQLEYVYNPRRKKYKKKILKMFYNYMKRAYGYDLKMADAGIALKKCKIPVMFIHSKNDKYVPIENLYKIADKIPEYRKDIYIVNEADHAMSYPSSPRKYEVHVREFLKKWGM